MTSYETVIVEPDGVTEASPEFMCHSNLDVSGSAFHRSFDTQLKLRANRLFSLDPASLSIRLPEGFGVPILSNHRLRYTAQVLNHNIVGDPFRRVTPMLGLPFDTSVHYITAHLHPFAESLELWDLTAKKSVFKTLTRQVEGAVGLAEVKQFASAEGLPLYKDHEYELISVYPNTSGVEQDAMATMFLYIRANDLEPSGLRPGPAG